LNDQASAVRIRSGANAFHDCPEKTLPQLCELSIDELARFLQRHSFGETDAKIATEALKEIRGRIGFCSASDWIT
jgi:excinuclease ABC subunit A